MSSEMLWHQRKPERWEAEQEIAGQFLDDLRSGVDDHGTAFLEGLFHVRSEHGHRYESVTVRVEYPLSFPKRGRCPRVILLSHRDRWQAGQDSHINGDWSLCLFVPGESRIDFQDADSLTLLFIDLQTFLFKEYLYQKDLALEPITGQRAVWPGQARSHGTAGIAEAIRDMGGVRRNQPCPCGSGKKFKTCCMRHIGR